MADETKQNAKLDELLLSYKQCADPRKKRMIHLSIVETAMEFVKRIANSIASQSSISNEDLIQVGSIGLIKAIEFYNPEKNTKFKTYASYFIKGEIKHYLRDKASLIKAPRELQELVFKISNTIKHLTQKGFSEPSVKQISENSGISEKKIQEVMEIEYCKSTLSLDQTLAPDDEDISLLDKIPSGDYQEILNSSENKIMLETAINKLPEELRKILELSYYEDLNQREIAERIGISQMQVSRRLKKALNKMYEIIKYN